MSTAAASLSASLSALDSAKGAQAQASLNLKGKAKVAAREFESIFLNSMFQNMFTGIDGDGPFGGSGALKVWRSFMTEQYANMFAKTGGIGIASHVYNELLRHQGLQAS
jgi:Rod binding domain-containing protein